MRTDKITFFFFDVFSRLKTLNELKCNEKLIKMNKHQNIKIIMKSNTHKQIFVICLASLCFPFSQMLLNNDLDSWNRLDTKIIFTSFHGQKMK